MKKIAQVIGSKRLTADVLTVAETVRNLNRRFSFDVIIPKDAEYRERFLGLGARVITFEETQKISVEIIMSFAKYFRENPADIVHTHVSVGARIGARLAGIKRCISSRGFNSKSENRARRLASPIYNAFTTVTLCTTQSLVDSLVKEGVRKDRIFPLLPYGALESLSVKLENDQEKETLIVCPLPFYKGFGQKTLLRAFARMQNKNSSRLLFVGDGPEKEESRLLAGRLGIGGRVEFNNDLTTKVYNTQSTLTVFTHEENWELPCALLRGGYARIVASDLPENKDLFSDTCEFYLRGDEFSLERALLRAIAGKDGPVLSDNTAPTPLGLLCESHEHIYTTILSL